MIKAHSVIKEAYRKGYRVRGGKVYSPFRELPLATHPNSKNYLRFSIKYSETGREQVLVHQLVAYQKYGNRVFIPGIEVRHLNNDCQDNSDENISIGTKSQNANDKDAKTRKRCSVLAATKNRKFTDEEMEEIRSYRRKGWTYKELMRAFNISSKGTLHYILNTKYQTTKV